MQTKQAWIVTWSLHVCVDLAQKSESCRSTAPERLLVWVGEILGSALAVNLHALVDFTSSTMALSNTDYFHQVLARTSGERSFHPSCCLDWASEARKKRSHNGFSRRHAVCSLRDPGKNRSPRSQGHRPSRRSVTGGDTGTSTALRVPTERRTVRM